MKLASAFNNSPNLVTLTRLVDDSYVDVNDSFERLLGYPRAAVIGKNPVALGLWDTAKRERFLAALRKTHSIANEPASYRRQDGGEYHGVLNAEVVSFEGEDYVLSIVQDTALHAHDDAANRRAMEAALQLSEQKYRTLVDYSQDGVFITQEDKYTYVNQAYADMLGYAPREMMGTPYSNFIAPEDRKFLSELWEKRRAGQWEQNAYEVHLLKKDGKTRVLASVRSGPITLDGRLSSTGTIRDITEERRTQQALLAAERKYRAIFENAVTGMYQSTPTGQYLKANQALAAIFGFDSPETLISSLKAGASDFIAKPFTREVLRTKLHRVLRRAAPSPALAT